MVNEDLDGKVLEALSEAKAHFEKLKKDADNPYFKSNYSDLNSLLDMIIPELTKVGIDLYQPLNIIETSNGEVIDILQTVFEHEDGSRLVSTTKLGEFTDIQKKGASITYLRRYMLKTLLALQDEDDDGETAVGRGSSFGGKKSSSKSSSSSKGLGKKKETKEEPKEESGDSFTSKRGRGRSAKKEESEPQEESKEDSKEESKEEPKQSRRGRGKAKDEPKEDVKEEKQEETSGRRRRRGK